ncbi:unnamed protein product [Didymodactylos carnosus]|uniref:HMG box domain-containing protein n=1 Tax=Didymodactylos carnosus TaxID=1234261 RepID=A0A813VPE5_9BILA|nr:unnamed protein product [Didymodactylos carnosus]CAF0981753.1 unnamed protein product [Didymodactylos carnosus]CAF3633905.1 unnamed protein product [Didymodactylos carnosus]CAF3752367.1 unnamed protein product [Didymodactylos carnosus]
MSLSSASLRLNENKKLKKSVQFIFYHEFNLSNKLLNNFQLIFRIKIIQQNRSPVYINNQQSSSSITAQQKQSLSPSSNYNQLHNTSPIKSLTNGDTITSLLNIPTSTTSSSSIVVTNNSICQLDNDLLTKKNNLAVSQEQTRQQFIQPFNYHCHYYQQQQHPFPFQQHHRYHCETNMIANHDNNNSNEQQHIINKSPVSTNLSPQQSSTSDLDDTTSSKINMNFNKIIKKKKTPKKKRKDPNEPQKPVSPYALFFRDTQNGIKKKLASPSFGEISKVVAHMWENIEPEVKEQYKRKAAAAKKEYLKKLAAYRAVQVSHQSPSMHLLGPNTNIYDTNQSPSVQHFSQPSRNENNLLHQHHRVADQQRFSYHHPHPSHMQQTASFCNPTSVYNHGGTSSLVQKQQHPYQHYHDYLGSSSTSGTYLNESMPQNNNNNYSYSNGESQMYQPHQFEATFQCDMTYDQQQHFGLLRPVDCGESFYCTEESQNQTQQQQQQTLSNCGETSNHNLLHNLTTLTPVAINQARYTDLNTSSTSIKCSPSMQSCTGDKQNFISNYQNSLMKCEDFNQTNVDSITGNYYPLYNTDQGGTKSEIDIDKLYNGQKGGSIRSSNDYHGWNNSCLTLNTPW